MRSISINLSDVSHSLDGTVGGAPSSTYLLFELEVPSDPPTRYRLVANHDAVEFMTDSQDNPLTYTPFPFAHDGIKLDGQGGNPQINLNVHNASLEFRLVVNAYRGFTGQPAVLRLINEGDLDTPSAQIRFDAKVVGVSVDQDIVAFSLASANLYERLIPRRRYQAQRCRHRYGGTDCGFPLSNPDIIANHPELLTRCRKSLAACEDRGAAEEAEGLEVLHPLRFGAERGLYRGTP